MVASRPLNRTTRRYLHATPERTDSERVTLGESARKGVGGGGRLGINKSITTRRPLAQHRHARC